VEILWVQLTNETTSYLAGHRNDNGRWGPNETAATNGEIGEGTILEAERYERSNERKCDGDYGA